MGSRFTVGHGAARLLLPIALAACVTGCFGRKGKTDPKISAVEKKFEQDVRFLIGRLRDIDTMDSIRELMRIGGPVVPHLIAALDDESFNVRAGCYKAIEFIAKDEYEYTEGFDYDPDPTNAQAGALRIRQIARIRQWWVGAKGTTPINPPRRGKKANEKKTTKARGDEQS